MIYMTVTLYVLGMISTVYVISLVQSMKNLNIGFGTWLFATLAWPLFTVLATGACILTAYKELNDE